VVQRGLIDESRGKRKRFFLKKEAKTFALLSLGSPRHPGKSLLVLCFRKELLQLEEPWRSAL
jgi:hypothetical protein